MNRRGRQGQSSSIPSLFDMGGSGATSNSGYNNGSSFGKSGGFSNNNSSSFGKSGGFSNSGSFNNSSSFSNSSSGYGGGYGNNSGFGGSSGYGSSFGSDFSSPSSGGALGLAAGLSLGGDSYNKGYGSVGSSSLLGSRPSMGDSGGYGDGLLGSGGGGGGFSSSFSSSLGGLSDDAFAAKVRLQQQLLAEEKQKSVQQQIQEQLERQNAKRLEYNRQKRERESKRRDDRRGDRRNDRNDSRRDSNRQESRDDALDDVQVTIKPRSEGRAVSDNTGGRKRNLSDRSRSQDENKEVKKPASSDDGAQGPWKCHVCVITCRDLKGYELHMKGRKHNEAMERMRQVTEFQTQQAVQRLEAERRIKKATGRYRDEDDQYCRDCLKHYRGDLLAHRRTPEHKEARRTQRPHCRVCNVTFKTPKKYVQHCNTPGHKKVYEAAKNKGENVDDENFVTVDSVGEFDVEDCNDATYGKQLAGREHVIPVWGYFCKPCCKFYQSVGSQGSVLDAHCKTKEHYEALKGYVDEGEEYTVGDDMVAQAIAQEVSM